MAVANVDMFDVRKTLFTTLNVAGLQALIGNPVRIYERMPRTAATFPYVRLTCIEGMPYGGVMAGPEWFRQETYRFVVFDKSTSSDATAAILKKIQDLIDPIAGTATTDGTISHYVPGNSGIRWDDDGGSWFGLVEYTFVITR